jgi:hypothetical protein
MDDQPEKEQTSPLDEKQDPLESTRGDTFILPGAGTRLRRMVNAAQEESRTPLSAPKEITLVVRGMSETVDFRSQQSVTLGRYDHKSTHRPDVDLSRFGAAERGVSREHARLELHNGDLFIVDLGSTNGSFVRGERMVPNEPYKVRHGEELILGRLAIQVMFVS